MENKFKKGDIVRLLDKKSLNHCQRPFIGKKGVVTDDHWVPNVLFKGAEDSTACNEYELELVVKKSKQPKLLPFNLEEALAGKPVVTRDGRTVTEFQNLAGLSGNKKHPLHAHIVGEGSMTFQLNGRNMDYDTSADLFMAKEPKKEKKTYWVNVYKKKLDATDYELGPDLELGLSYHSKEEADNAIKSCPGFIKTIKIKL